MSGRASHQFQNVRPETSQKFQVVLQNPEQHTRVTPGERSVGFHFSISILSGVSAASGAAGTQTLCRGWFPLPLRSGSQGSLGVSGTCLGCTGEGAGSSSAVAALLEVDANIGLPALLRH